MTLNSLHNSRILEFPQFNLQCCGLEANRVCIFYNVMSFLDPFGKQRHTSYNIHFQENQQSTKARVIATLTPLHMLAVVCVLWHSSVKPYSCHDIRFIRHDGTQNTYPLYFVSCNEQNIMCVIKEQNKSDHYTALQSLEFVLRLMHACDQFAIQFAAEWEKCRQWKPSEKRLQNLLERIQTAAPGFWVSTGTWRWLMRCGMNWDPCMHYSWIIFLLFCWVLAPSPCCRLARHFYRKNGF